MTPIQRAMCDECAAMMREFYKDPENERKFQEWSIDLHHVLTGQHLGDIPIVNYEYEC